MARMSAVDRRVQLVEAAIAVMTRDGVSRATTRAIAAEAGVPLSAVHYAFRSKQELLGEVTEAIARQSKADIDSAIFTLAEQGGPQALVDVVRAGLNAYFDHVVAHPREHLLTYELTHYAVREEGFEDAARRQYEYYLEQNTALIAALADLLGFEYIPPVEVVSRLVFSAMDGLALNYLAYGKEEEARQVLDLAASTLVTMVRWKDPA